MTDKEKIRAEVERLYKEVKAEEDAGYNDALDDIKAFIDSMQEEPVSEDLWEAAQTYYEELQKEKFEGSDVIDAFYAGNKWKKQQMMKEAHIYKVEQHYDRRIGKYLTPDITLNENLFKVNDEVKLIIIKEDEQ